MFSGNEWLIVVIVALVLFGGSQLPKLARNVGRAQTELKKGLKEGAAEANEASKGAAEANEASKDAASDSPTKSS